MRTKAILTLSVTLVALLASRSLWAGPWEGTIKVGGIVLDEEGDRSAVQETYNIYDGFSLSRIRLSGSPGEGNRLMFDLREINLDGRQGEALFTRTNLLRLTASYDEHRQIFDPSGSINSRRKDLDFGARVTPTKWLKLDGTFNYMKRDGSRESFPAGTVSELGTGYDYSMRTGSIGAEARKDRRGVAVDYRLTDFTNDRNVEADRTGDVVSARIWTPGYFFPDKVTHLFRGAYGVSKLAKADISHTLSSFQYTGVVRPVREIQLKYNFDAQRLDDESTRLKTDRFLHNVDATLYHQDGSVFGGYSYETNDDDRHLTSYNSWRVGASLRGAQYSARVRYAGREKKDLEELTLLKNVEASRFRADLTVNPLLGLDVGFGYNVRDREFPDIDVKSEGEMLRGNIGYSYSGWGRLSATYTYSNDLYTDRVAGYDVNSHVVTARADFERIRDIRLSGGVTYLDIRKDMDIEKSMVFVEGEYTLAKDYHFEIKYNVYNYDDYVLLDRYYTANVVWFNVAYDFHLE